MGVRSRGLLASGEWVHGYEDCSSNTFKVCVGSGSQKHRQHVRTLTSTVAEIGFRAENHLAACLQGGEIEFAQHHLCLDAEGRVRIASA